MYVPRSHEREMREAAWGRACPNSAKTTGKRCEISSDAGREDDGDAQQAPARHLLSQKSLQGLGFREMAMIARSDIPPRLTA